MCRVRYAYIFWIFKKRAHTEPEIYVNVFVRALCLLYGVRTIFFILSRNKIKQKMDIIEKENYKVVEVRLPMPHHSRNSIHADVWTPRYLLFSLFCSLHRFAAVLHWKRRSNRLEKLSEPFTCCLACADNFFFVLLFCALLSMLHVCYLKAHWKLLCVSCLVERMRGQRRGESRLNRFSNFAVYWVEAASRRNMHYKSMAATAVLASL